MFICEWAELESMMSKVHPLDERVDADEEDFEAVSAACARLKVFTAHGESLTVVTEQGKEVCETLGARICALVDSAATRDEELDVLLWFER